jgi:hypothetical protein
VEDLTNATADNRGDSSVSQNIQPLGRRELVKIELRTRNLTIRFNVHH